MKTSNIAVILLAAGNGERFGGILPKQFVTIGGASLWRIAYANLRSALPEAHIAIIGNSKHQHLWDLHGLVGDFTWVEGGATRSDSVQAGLAALASYAPPKYILVHDAARPFVQQSVIAELLNALQAGAVAAIPAIPAIDTIKRVAAGKVLQTLERSELWQVQTPQAFDYAMLRQLHASNVASITDDAALFEYAGEKVQVVQGSKLLFKVTDTDDLELARKISPLGYYPTWQIEARSDSPSPCGRGLGGGQRNIVLGGQRNVFWAEQTETISAMGYDVHCLVDTPPDTPQYIRLGGIDITHHQHLSGHSDADVVLHAITDAVLGLVGAGDIGQHFPPSNAAFKGGDSAMFLRHAMQILAAKGGELLHIDATIICESPKIAPYREAMRHRIADIMGVNLHRISIKATTTEGLGFTGRREGIATQAIATAKLAIKPN